MIAIFVFPDAYGSMLMGNAQNRVHMAPIATPQVTQCVHCQHMRAPEYGNVNLRLRKHLTSMLHDSVCIPWHVSDETWPRGVDLKRFFSGVTCSLSSYSQEFVPIATNQILARGRLFQHGAPAT